MFELFLSICDHHHLANISNNSKNLNVPNYLPSPCALFVVGEIGNHQSEVAVLVPVEKLGRFSHSIIFFKLMKCASFLSGTSIAN